MTVRELLKRCLECEANREPAWGLEICERVILSGAKGRLLVTALRYKASFLYMADPGWKLEAAGFAKDALLVANDPADKAAILNLLVGLYAGAGSVEIASEYADHFFRLAEQYPIPAVVKWTPKVWFNLGCLHDTKMQHQEATHAYEKAVETSSFSAGEFNPGYALHNLVQMYLETGRVGLAVEALQKARLLLGSRGDSSREIDQEAQCLLAQGQLNEADDLCRSLLNRTELSVEVRAEVLLTRARIAAARGLADEAAQLGDEALAVAVKASNLRLVHKVGGVLRTLR